MDYWFWSAKLYSYVYGAIKDSLGVNLRGLGFLLRRVTSDRILSVHGLRVFFSHEMSEAYARTLHGGWNEPETHYFLRSIMSECEIKFVDVGANIGEIFLDVARSPNCVSAVAFEPNPLAVSVINKNLGLNQIVNTRVVEKALGDCAIETKMFFGRHSPSASLLSTAKRNAKLNGGQLTNVVVSTLDSEISDEELSGSNIVVLIDVEGFELKVIQGGLETISKHHPVIIFEYHQETRKVFTLDHVSELLGKEYELFRLRNDGFLDRDLTRTWNCVAVPALTVFGKAVRQKLCVE